MSQLHKKTITEEDYLEKLAAEKREKDIKRFHYACSWGYYGEVGDSIDSGIDINAPDKYGRTPLMWACNSPLDNYSTVELLLKNGADVNSKSYFGDTALSLAKKYKHQNIVDLLKQYGAKENMMIENSYNNLRKTFIEAVLEKVENEEMIDDFLTVCHTGDIGSVKEFIDQGIDVNSSNVVGCTPLIEASSYGHLDVVKILIQNGANSDHKDKDGLTALMYASMEGYTEIVDYLLRTGAKPDITDDENNFTSLMFASKYGNYGVASNLIFYGADVNFNNGVTTPLMVACSNYHESVAELLIKAGADINWKDTDGNTALSIAKKRGFQEVIDMLMRYGAKE